jgi:hypothetical protein
MLLFTLGITFMIALVIVLVFGWIAWSDYRKGMSDAHNGESYITLIRERFFWKLYLRGWKKQKRKKEAESQHPA